MRVTVTVRHTRYRWHGLGWWMWIGWWWRPLVWVARACGLR